jgi:hypothetical protein
MVSGGVIDFLWERKVRMVKRTPTTFLVEQLARWHEADKRLQRMKRDNRQAIRSYEWQGGPVSHEWPEGAA